jgi:hypothetical protein
MANLQAASAPIQAGDVIRVMAHFTQPPKPKILICVCPIKFKYLVISSKPFALAMSAQLKVELTELKCLEHTSYVDTSKLITLSAMETQYVVDADQNCHKGALLRKLRQEIKAMVLAHGIMPKDQTNLIGQNL